MTGCAPGEQIAGNVFMAACAKVADASTEVQGRLAALDEHVSAVNLQANEKMDAVLEKLEVCTA